MTHIVERLRKVAEVDSEMFHGDGDIFAEAADVLEKMERKLTIAYKQNAMNTLSQCKVEKENADLQARVDELEAEIKQLRKWQEFVRYNSKEAGYLADDYMTQQEME